jgi:hypothetical protein
MSKKNIITNMEAFNLASKLQTPEILNIKDTDFALAVIANTKSIVDEYNKIAPLLTPTEGWSTFIEDVKSQEDLDKLKEDSANDELFAERQAQVDAYNAELEKEFGGRIKKVKIKNTVGELSAQDLGQLELMLKS